MQRLGKVAGSKAIDFIALRRNDPRTLFFIEISDLRGFRIENKEHLRGGALAVEVAQKVRDTIAGIVGACRVSGSPTDWKPFVRALVGTSTLVQVLFWLEQDLPQTPRERTAIREQTLNSELKKRMRWLTSRVLVASLGDATCPPGLRVTNTAGD